MNGVFTERVVALDRFRVIVQPELASARRFMARLASGSFQQPARRFLAPAKVFDAGITRDPLLAASHGSWPHNQRF